MAGLADDSKERLPSDREGPDVIGVAEGDQRPDKRRAGLAHGGAARVGIAPTRASVAGLELAEAQPEDGLASRAWIAALDDAEEGERAARFGNLEGPVLDVAPVGGAAEVDGLLARQQRPLGVDRGVARRVTVRRSAAARKKNREKGRRLEGSQRAISLQGLSADFHVNFARRKRASRGQAQTQLERDERQKKEGDRGAGVDGGPPLAHPRAGRCGEGAAGAKSISSARGDAIRVSARPSTVKR